MKSKFSVKDILLPTVILLLICVVAAALLGGTNAMTKEKIASIDLKIKADAMQAVLVEADSFGDGVIISDTLEYSEAKKGDEVIGYAFTVTESGYGGKIKVMVGILPDGKVSKVMVIAADNETPGLGQNVKKDSFLNQFIGKLTDIEVVKGAPSNDSEIQAVTSATISSKAVTRAVNAATAYANENLLKGGN